mmetsp:Transcript_42784/g.118181  ORF Transcript_42784/g.118181 Transcript_42784/m.118181 type:complete len:203 (-) Transcript_42784:559-1167(-)
MVWRRPERCADPLQFRRGGRCHSGDVGRCSPTGLVHASFDQVRAQQAWRQDAGCAGAEHCEGVDANTRVCFVDSEVAGQSGHCARTEGAGCGPIHGSGPQGAALGQPFRDAVARRHRRSCPRANFRGLWDGYAVQGRVVRERLCLSSCALLVGGGGRDCAVGFGRQHPSWVGQAHRGALQGHAQCEKRNARDRTRVETDFEE